MQVPIPYPIDIMVREKAIVLNLESIRMIITQDQVNRHGGLMPNIVHVRTTF